MVGHAATIAAGEWITASGEWVNDRTHGKQFKARFLRTSAPTSVDGIEKYLSSGTGLSRPSNRSLFTAPIPAGKKFGEARDWAGIFSDDCLLRLDRDSLSRVSLAKAATARRCAYR